MGCTLALELLRNRIDFLMNCEYIDIRNIKVELSLILDFINSHPILRDAYNSIKQKKDESSSNYTIRKFQEVKKKLAVVLANTLINHCAFFEELKGNAELENILQAQIEIINIQLLPNIDKYELGDEVLLRLQRVLGSSSEIDSEPKNQYYQAVQALFKIGAEYFKNRVVSSNKCEFLQKIYDEFMKIYSKKKELPTERKAIGCPLVMDIIQLIYTLYLTYRCQWSLDLIKAEIQKVRDNCAPIGSSQADQVINTEYYLLQKVAELFFFEKTAGELNCLANSYFNIEPKYKSLKDMQFPRIIEKLEDMAEINSHFLISSSAENILKARREIISYLNKLFIALKETIELPKENLIILRKFKEKVQNFERFKYYRIATDKKEKNKEAVITMLLCSYLHDNNKKPFYNPERGYPNFAGRKIDVADRSFPDALILEVKIISANQKDRILRGFNQIYHYVDDCSERVGYYIIFNIWENKIIDIPINVPFDNGIIIYNLVIDITKTSVSTTILETINISESELKGSI